MGRNGLGGTPALASLQNCKSFGLGFYCRPLVWLCFPRSFETSWWKGLNVEFVVSCSACSAKPEQKFLLVSAAILLLQPCVCLNLQFKTSCGIAEISKQQKFSSDPW